MFPGTVMADWLLMWQRACYSVSYAIGKVNQSIRLIIIVTERGILASQIVLLS